MTDAALIAKRCADVIAAKDAAMHMLGMQLEACGPGRARIGMLVRPDMVNGHGMCHGGFIFTLADCAFAVACNTYNQRAVAQQCAVTFIRAAKPGDRLTADATERARAGRSGIYDIRVTDAAGVTVAEFRGHSRTIEGTVLD